MTLEQWLKSEPFTLSLSAGFFGFFAHAGLLCALDEAGIKPAKVTGASAGALAGGLYCAGMTPAQIRDLFLSLTRKQFWDPALGLGLLKGELFQQVLLEHTNGMDICNSTTPFVASIYNLRTKQADTPTSGNLATIIRASCTIPVLLQPVRFNGERYIDGGMTDRWAIQSLQPNERTLYHHIVSRSPWRKKTDPALSIPNRDNLSALALHNLPRSGPFKLEQGPIIFDLAYRLAQQALKQEHLHEQHLYA